MFTPANRAPFTLQELQRCLAFLKSEACGHGVHGQIGEIPEGDSGIARCEAGEAEELAPRGQP